MSSTRRNLLNAVDGIFGKESNDEGDLPLESTHTIPPLPLVSALITSVASLQDMQEAKPKAFLSQPIQPIDRSRFQTMEEVFTWKTPSISDWKDLSPGRRACMRLEYLGDERIVEIATYVFNGVKKRVSPRVVAGLFILAYNLRDSAGMRAFEEVPAELIQSEEECEWTEFTDSELVHVVPSVEMSTNVLEHDGAKFKKLATGYCYLAASYMRLFTRSVENYSMIGEHLSKRFLSFYRYPIPFKSFHPEKEAITSIKSAMELDSCLKNTFYNLLYAGEICSECRNLKDYLYVTQVSFTGLHPYTLFVKAMEELNINNVELAKTLWSPKIKTELAALADVFKNLHGSTSEEYKAQMWKFARIFNYQFLSDLQTKKCRFFTMVMAQLLYLINPVTHKDVMLITEINKMEGLTRLLAMEYAKRAYALFSRQVFDGNFQNLEQAIQE